MEHQGKEAPAPVIKKKHKDEHKHSTAWKIALADFAMAMMALFLLLWIMNASSKQEQQLIAQYFQDPEKGRTDVGIGRSKINRPDAKLKGAIDQKRSETLLATNEKGKLQELKSLIEAKIEANSVLQAYKDHIQMDVIPEGLRIQIADSKNRAMFEAGSAVMNDFASSILANLADSINSVQNRISISGHTDGVKYSQQTYTNWELSADRANAARRALVYAGLEPDKIVRVLGMADSVLLDKDNPHDPLNRRISIVILNQNADNNIIEQESSQDKTTKLDPG